MYQLSGFDLRLENRYSNKQTSTVCVLITYTSINLLQKQQINFILCENIIEIDSEHETVSGVPCLQSTATIANSSSNLIRGTVNFDRLQEDFLGVSFILLIHIQLVVRFKTIEEDKHLQTSSQKASDVA